ncbi:MAG: DNA polymerase V [Proteobacteria bacterium]|nr:DNA polymerase V [Pseudomonadota bacterium]
MSQNKQRGGARKGAGRPKGTGKFGEPTTPVRVPVSMVREVAELVELRGRGLPLYTSRVQAGMPTAADDSLEGKLDLHSHVVRHPGSTFFVRVQGDSMLNAGIHEGDILVVDRSLEAREGSIVIAVLDGELTVKRLRRKNGQVELVPENDRYPVIVVHPEQEFRIWGVVTTVVHSV